MAIRWSTCIDRRPPRAASMQQPTTIAGLSRLPPGCNALRSFSRVGVKCPGIWDFGKIAYLPTPGPTRHDHQVGSFEAAYLPTPTPPPNLYSKMVPPTNILDRIPCGSQPYESTIPIIPEFIPSEKAGDPIITAYSPYQHSFPPFCAHDPAARARAQHASMQPGSWRNFNHLFGVCAAQVFLAWCGRGPNHRPPLVNFPRRRVSRVGAASGRITGRRPDRNLAVGATVYMPGRQWTKQRSERRRELSHIKQPTIVKRFAANANI